MFELSLGIMVKKTVVQISISPVKVYMGEPSGAMLSEM
jgi:hypothetical protein